MFVFIRFKRVWGPTLNWSLLGSLHRNCVAPVYTALIPHLPSIRYEEFLRVLKEVACLIEILRDFFIVDWVKAVNAQVCIAVGDDTMAFLSILCEI